MKKRTILVRVDHVFLEAMPGEWYMLRFQMRFGVLEPLFLALYRKQPGHEH